MYPAQLSWYHLAMLPLCCSLLDRLKSRSYTVYIIKFLLHRFAPREIIQDSLGFWTPRCKFRIPGTGFLIPCRWNVDSGFQSLAGIMNSLKWIVDSKAQDSGIHEQKFARFRNPDCLTYGKSTVGLEELNFVGRVRWCFVFLSFSKTTEVVINNDILEDIQVIEHHIRSSDQQLYEVINQVTI